MLELVVTAWLVATLGCLAVLAAVVVAQSLVSLLPGVRRTARAAAAPARRADPADSVLGEDTRAA